MPCHHVLAEALHAYIAAAGIAEDRRGWLFRTAKGHVATVLADRPMGQADAWSMIRRRAQAAGIAGTDRQSHHAGDWDHCLSRKWWRAGACTLDFGARESSHHQTMR